MTVNPRIENLPAWVSAGVRQVAAMAELPEIFPKAYQQVAGAIAAAGGELRGPAYAHYFGMPSDTVDVEIGFGMVKAMDVPGLVVTQNPETRAAMGTHVGPYSELSNAYGELMEWMTAQHLPTTDDMFEFYDSEPGVAPEETVTRMVFPLAE